MVGGVVGLIALALVILFFIRRRRFHKAQQQKPVDLLHENDGSNDNLPQFYRPEPFVVPEPSATSVAGGGTAAATEMREGTDARPSYDRRTSHYSGLTAEDQNEDAWDMRKSMSRDVDREHVKGPDEEPHVVQPYDVW